jgi:hypothetical protein
MTNQESHTLMELMGLDRLSEERQSEVMERFGALVIEGSIGQLLVSLSEEKTKEIEEYANNLPEGEDVFEYLLKTYPDFEPIVKEQIEALGEEIREIYGSGESS